jgi:hypothetical protein
MYILYERYVAVVSGTLSQRLVGNSSICHELRKLLLSRLSDARRAPAVSVKVMAFLT